MKKIIILLLCSLSLVAQAQHPTKRPLRVGIQASADHAFRSLVNNRSGTGNGIVIDQRNKNELAKIGYHVGLMLWWPLNDRVALETGLQYANKGYQTKKLPLVFAAPSPGLPVAAQFEYAYRYLGVPINARFTLGKGNLKLIVGAGLSANFLLGEGQRNRLFFKDSVQQSRQAGNIVQRKFELASMVSAGVQYKLSNVLYALLEPVYRLGLTRINDQSVSERLWSGGISLSLYRSLR